MAHGKMLTRDYKGGLGGDRKMKPFGKRKGMQTAKGVRMDTELHRGTEGGGKDRENGVGGPLKG